MPRERAHATSRGRGPTRPYQPSVIASLPHEKHLGLRESQGEEPFGTVCQRPLRADSNRIPMTWTDTEKAAPTDGLNCGKQTGRPARKGPGSSNFRAKCPLLVSDVLLSHGLLRSTIGARGLNFRVRNGTGCASPAMVADQQGAFCCQGRLRRALGAAQRDVGLPSGIARA